MAEGFEAYHVPQQSRREKLRVVSHINNQHAFFPPGCAGLLPLYDPSLIPSDFLTCASTPLVHNNNPDSSNLQIDPATIQIINSTPFLGFPHSNNSNTTREPLSLSLSSSSPVNVVLPRNDVVSGGSSSSHVLPMGPFTGYASVLKGSRFLKPAQQLLEELCDFAGREVYAPEKMMSDDMTSFLDPPSSSQSFTSADGADGSKKKSRLLTMLDEVYRRYRQYYEQMEAVVSSFEYVSGLGNAAPYATLAIKAMSKHFKCLKNVITDQLDQFTNSNNSKAHFHNISDKKDDSPRFGNDGHRRSGGPYSQIRGIHNPEFLGHQPNWRPQRGLPERAVTVLRACYPTDSDKLMLAKQTGLSRSQVSNWFINARVRVWKPMVEEIHTLETRQSQKNPQIITEEQNNKNKFQDSPFKRTRNNYEAPPPQVAYDNAISINNNNNEAGVGGGAATNGVSLTLGLHQNNGGLAPSDQPFHPPISEAHRFGLGLQVPSSNEGFVMSGSQESQNRHHLHLMGGHLLHDFVG
ncbi:BEL1-like homeodomain protein 9 [Senna tora]|uniref:BEL1-like homeodomain protein 9 n=1 Tax=Senna tora TaxID=362788 RepID=A0A834TPC0_9FABA|nr:BEL1-like homeodomain protein 9 [Senna tora]